MPLASPLRRDRALVALGLAGFAALCWIATVFLVTAMHPAHLAHGAVGVQLAPLFLMWAVMMAAMMVPVSTPSLLAVVRAEPRSADRAAPVRRSALFLSGDLLVWTAFSLFAAMVQWRLHRASLLDAHRASLGAAASGGLLLAIGLYQVSPLKRACPRRCRAQPTLAGDSRNRARDDFFRGLEHGAFSAGSCGALMFVLFATGVMSLPGMALLTGLLVLERIAPAELRVSLAAGAMLLFWGGCILLANAA
jgi:predicted metal-binding membrane protein